MPFFYTAIRILGLTNISVTVRSCMFLSDSFTASNNSGHTRCFGKLLRLSGLRRKMTGSNQFTAEKGRNIWYFSPKSAPFSVFLTMLPLIASNNKGHCKASQIVFPCLPPTTKDIFTFFLLFTAKRSRIFIFLTIAFAVRKLPFFGIEAESHKTGKSKTCFQSLFPVISHF